MDWFISHYLGGDEHSEPLASPLLHEDLSGLAAALHRDLRVRPARDEGEAYADALRSSGGQVESKRYDGLIHGAANMTGVLDLGVNWSPTFPRNCGQRCTTNRPAAPRWSRR